MQRFLLKHGVEFQEGEYVWRVQGGLPDGRIEFSSDYGSPIRVPETEVWERHSNGRWSVRIESLLETGASPIIVVPRDVSTFEEKDIVVMRARLVYLRAVEEAKCSRVREVETVIRRVACEVGALKPPNYRTFCRWKKRYQHSRDVMDVVPRHENKGRREILEGPLLTLVEDVIETHYLNDQKLNVARLFDRVEEAIAVRNERDTENPLPTISRATLYRHVETLNSYLVTAAREGRTEAVKRYRPVFRKLKTKRLNERWEIDHTPVNLMCVCERTRMVIVRPVLTLIIDAHTRMVMGFHIGARSPGQEEVGWAMKMAMLSKRDLLNRLGLGHLEWLARGVAEMVVGDNAWEFHGSAMRAGCDELGISLVYCPRRAPWFKGRIERFMRTIAEQLFHLIPGTTRSNTKDRGDYPSEKLACVSLEELTVFVVRWIVECYQHAPHRGLKRKTPAQVWQESARLTPIYMPADPDQLSIAFSDAIMRPITNSGVTFDHLSYNSSALQLLRHSIPDDEKVRVRYFNDQIGHIFVYDPRSKEYLRVDCTDPDYAKDLTRWMHNEVTGAMRDSSIDINPVSLRKARIRLADDIAKAELDQKLKKRKWAAQIKGKSSKEILMEIANGNTAGDAIESDQVEPMVVRFDSVPEFSVMKRTER
ncbi:MAG: DDE-type integrase/transposase/recombinase [Burkholderia sp.]|jgi:putative transposase|uniref:Mu transposase C-terminal domain-containing protein n=1 Tax=Burkholderia sp. TaxID=36773 RepID=UPI002586072F|nr:Mu transposase C-terminal domain-containing protein [Burkholderia sp.]MCA3783130.1 DDE-type integrase/transposase/recombinase [Burkholderia sp.]MCA3792117.1 DDE-type integrase/transposase/recombinase [Burkholderia sp.]MCA3820988.1 DDE-type integrase/transposase/recombinase [Burkholderia sp.]MCA3837826.1 DDE-type integrase/transposase/recombinase [Burkholderia sp.]MCA3851079.1 DDE-type integrase/transposase/recombinase [Burkholderia sp.]